MKRKKNLTGSKIRFYRKQRKWSQNRMASILQARGIDISRQIIANIETQRRAVTDYEIANIAKALRIPIMLFFGDDVAADLYGTTKIYPPARSIVSPPLENQPTRKISDLVRRLFRRIKPSPRKPAKSVTASFSWWKKVF